MAFLLWERHDDDISVRACRLNAGACCGLWDLKTVWTRKFSRDWNYQLIMFYSRTHTNFNTGII